VSYSRHDEALVKPLAALLGVAAEDAVFLDVPSLKPGDLWEEKILGAVRESSVFVLCWCCECKHSTFIAKEISAALAEGNRRLVPVLFCSTPLPPGMADRQWIDLRGQVAHHCPVAHVVKKKVPRNPREKMLYRLRPRQEQTDKTPLDETQEVPSVPSPAAILPFAALQPTDDDLQSAHLAEITRSYFKHLGRK
jgi:hypothetical protein